MYYKHDKIAMFLFQTVFISWSRKIVQKKSHKILLAHLTCVGQYVKFHLLYHNRLHCTELHEVHLFAVVACSSAHVLIAVGVQF